MVLASSDNSISCSSIGPVSRKIGGLPYLSWIWDYGVLGPPIAMIVADFGAICLLMLLEGRPPWERELYRTFLWNDVLFIPLYFLVAAAVLRHAPPQRGFHTRRWWHVSLLAGTFAVSALLEAIALYSGQYTLSQELSPSKLWHTLIFGIAGYWLLSSLVPVIMTPKPAWAIVLLLLAAAGGFYNCYRDLTLPYPRDAHLEGTYVPWHWQPRL